MSRALIVGFVVAVVIVVVIVLALKWPFGPPEDGGPVIVIDPGDQDILSDIPVGRLGIRKVTCSGDAPVGHKTTGGERPSIPSRFVHTNGISRVVVTKQNGSTYEVNAISFDVEGSGTNPVSLERNPNNHQATWKLNKGTLPGESSIPLTQWPEEMIGPITRIDFGDGVDKLAEVKRIEIYYYKAHRGKPCN